MQSACGVQKGHVGAGWPGGGIEVDLGCMAPGAAPPGLREPGPAPPPGLKEVNSWLLLRCMGRTGLSIMLSCRDGMRLQHHQMLFRQC